MRPLPRPLQALATWTAILPLVLLVSTILTPITLDWPAPARTVLVITIVVPIAVFWAVPLLAQLTQRLRGTPQDEVAASYPGPGIRDKHLTPPPGSGRCGAAIGADAERAGTARVGGRR